MKRGLPTPDSWQIDAYRLELLVGRPHARPRGAMAKMPVVRDGLTHSQVYASPVTPDVVPDLHPSATECPLGFCIYTRRCTRRTPLCYRMLPDVITVLKLRIFLFLNTYLRLVAFCSRGVYVWYNVWYKCQILPKQPWLGGAALQVHFAQSGARLLQAASIFQPSRRLAAWPKPEQT